MVATSISQSKELLRLGLSAETADMYYQKVLPKSDKIEHNPKVGNPVAALEWYNKGYTHFGESPLTLEEFCVPAWSLSALLEVMPSSAYIDCKMKQDGFGYWECVFEYDGDIKVRHRTKQSTSSGKPDPTSTAYAMVVWLLTNNFIEEGGQDD